MGRLIFAGFDSKEPMKIVGIAGDVAAVGAGEEARSGNIHAIRATHV
jgi:hypothetical protein